MNFLCTQTNIGGVGVCKTNIVHISHQFFGNMLFAYLHVYTYMYHLWTAEGWLNLMIMTSLWICERLNARLFFLKVHVI